MAELGERARDYHRHIAEDASGVDVLVAVGELAREYLNADVRERLWAPTAADAGALLRDALEPGDVVLVKGSRAVGLEAVAEALAAVPA